MDNIKYNELKSKTLDIINECVENSKELNLPQHNFGIYKNSKYGLVGCNYVNFDFDKNREFVINTRCTNRIRLYLNNLYRLCKKLELKNISYLHILIEYTCYHELYHSYQSLNKRFIGKNYLQVNLNNHDTEMEADMYAYKKLLKKYIKNTNENMIVKIIFLDFIPNFIGIERSWTKMEKAEIAMEKLISKLKM